MELFIDTADVSAIRRWLDWGVIDGVTTNPSIMLKDGAYDMESRAREIAEIVFPRPVSVEVTTNDHEEMVEQARRFAGWGANVVAKIPVINEFGEPSLGVVRTLEESGVRVNVTACLSFGQAAMAAKAGATYVSIFAGRVADEGNDPARLVAQFIEWLARWDYSTKLICGSVRGAGNIQEWALAGAHVITVPPQILAKFVDHHYSRESVRGFNEDAQTALERMEQTGERRLRVVSANGAAVASLGSLAKARAR